MCTCPQCNKRYHDLMFRTVTNTQDGKTAVLCLICIDTIKNKLLWYKKGEWKSDFDKYEEAKEIAYILASKKKKKSIMHKLLKMWKKIWE